MTPRTFDIAVIGSGFAGSLLAMIARRLGRSVVLLERDRHPRFAVGESSTPLANLLLEQLARRYDLPRLLPLTQWGSWRRAYPQVRCGLKRGFTFYHHGWGHPFAADPQRRDQLLVAASPCDEQADTHWYRADFDEFLVGEARSSGVEYFDRVRLFPPAWRADGAAEVRGTTDGQPLALRARFVADATGPRGFLHRALGLAETAFADLPPTQGLYTHFAGVRRLERMGGLVPAGEVPPYPVDDAAVHHVFDGGWVWVLHFDDGTTSAGVAATDARAGPLRLADGAAAWERLLRGLPTVQAQFADAKPLLGFAHVPRLSFRTAAAAGAGWAMLPSAAGFVDPLLSTGFPLTLLGVARLAEAIERHWGSASFPRHLAAYGRRTLSELDAAARLVAAMYAGMRDFPVFAAVSLLYFAAASYTETAHRAGRPEAAASFLLWDDPRFGPELRACLSDVIELGHPGSCGESNANRVIERIRRAIGPVDVAGFGDTGRGNWYPLTEDDVRRSMVRFASDDSL